MEAIGTERAHAKLTRRLAVTGVRPDGYHLLDAEMVSLDLADTLEFARGRDLEVRDEVAWFPDGGAGGFSVPADDSNLVSRALAAAGAEAAVRLTKRIPAGAGLGGGSSDAAAVLRHFGVTDLSVAVALGADVPFCLAGGRARVRGVGELLEPLTAERLGFVVVTPPFGVSTSAVYRAFDAVGAPDGGGPNDLVAAACLVEPRLGAWFSLLADATGREPALAGSGSSVFVECEPGECELVAAAVRQRVREVGERAVITPARAVVSAERR